MTASNHKRYTQIGLDRQLRLKWLEQTATLVLAGHAPEAVKLTLQEDLRGSFHSSPAEVRGSLDKTITVLQKVWVRPPPELASLRFSGLELLQDRPRTEHLAVHWGMVMAVYPFWSVVATQVGRLLRLQGSAAAAHVQRRVWEQYGERETVSRRVRYVLRSYLDWGVLQEASARGIYRAGSSLAVEDTRLIAWLVEAFLHSRTSGSSPLPDLFDSPSLFPFQIRPVPAESLVAASSRLEILRHGLDENLFMLRK